ncbi:MAG: hypothetical protein DRJ01_00775 [Bacteroidetes bacterium]|nr:MAG: hypothetical protein DRJ01_00775 [Bacteroidota bacterium]
MFRKLFYLIIISLVIVSCNRTNDSEENIGEDIEIPDSIFDDKPLMISEEAMGDIIENISSPVEMAALLKQTGVPFSKKYLCDVKRIDQLNTNFKRALNLGILGSDLGYLNMYDKTGSVMNSMSSIKTLADELKIGQFFDFETIKRLAVNHENLDSLMYISVSSFNNMDTYLRETNRSDISSLIVVGTWIEGMYFATQVAKSVPNGKIVERIGEQKLILNDILLILKNYQSDKHFYDLVKDVEQIKESYKDVKITYTVGEPESKEINGMLVIVTNDESHVEISNEQLVNITNIIEKVRNKLINL